MKCIKISNCKSCPHIGHTGGFTSGGAKPCCDNSITVHLKGADCFKRVIPYKNEPIEERSMRNPKSIPKWCPLNDTNPFNTQELLEALKAVSLQVGMIEHNWTRSEKVYMDKVLAAIKNATS